MRAMILAETAEDRMKALDILFEFQKACARFRVFDHCSPVRVCLCMVWRCRVNARAGLWKSYKPGAWVLPLLSISARFHA